MLLPLRKSRWQGSHGFIHPSGGFASTSSGRPCNNMGGSGRSASLARHPPFNSHGCCPEMLNTISLSMQDLSERKAAPRESHQPSSAVISINVMH